VTTTSLYFGEVEIVNPEAGANSAEVVRWYPHPNVRISRERGVSPQTDYLQGRDLAFFVAKKRRHLGDDHGVFL